MDTILKKLEQLRGAANALKVWRREEVERCTRDYALAEAACSKFEEMLIEVNKGNTDQASKFLENTKY